MNEDNKEIKSGFNALSGKAELLKKSVAASLQQNEFISKNNRVLQKSQDGLR